MLTTSETSTALELDSKEGKAFLKRVIRENKNGSREWRLRSTAKTGWRLEFSCDVPPKTIGDVEQRVRVEFTETIYLYGRFGVHQSFSDSKPVDVPAPSRVYMTSACAVAMVARFLLDGWRLEISACHGSTSSSHHGIGATSFRASMPGSFASVELSRTTYVDGRRVISGDVNE